MLILELTSQQLRAVYIPKPSLAFGAKLTNSVSTKLVIWDGSQGSTIGPNKITNYVRNSTNLSPIIEGVLVGALLSDGC